jgi:hypothetical protein
MRETLLAVGRCVWVWEGPRMRPCAENISPYERALSATDVSYEGQRLADTELLTLPTTHDETMGHLHRLNSAPPPCRLRRSLMPDAHYSMRALASRPPLPYDSLSPNDPDQRVRW